MTETGNRTCLDRGSKQLNRERESQDPLYWGCCLHVWNRQAVITYLRYLLTWVGRYL